jgi:hypothetical protein
VLTLIIVALTIVFLRLQNAGERAP